MTTKEFNNKWEDTYEIKRISKNKKEGSSFIVIDLERAIVVYRFLPKKNHWFTINSYCDRIMPQNVYNDLVLVNEKLKEGYK